MDYTILGRTGLNVSVMSVGCGGRSRAGKNTGRTEAESIALIRHAVDAGVNIIDTAESYGTEELLGKAIKGLDRESIILATKKGTPGRATSKDVERSLEQSLKYLGTDYIDIYNLHAVTVEDYDYIVSEIVPTLLKCREQGKIRFIGITQRFNYDPQHNMFQRALQDDIWDVMMVGFNIINQSARDRVLAKAIEKNIGIMAMFVVRLALSRKERLVEVIQGLVDAGQIDPADIDMDNPLDFLVYQGGAVSIVDAAYRFCRYEPGIHVTLSGTGNMEHLKSNIESFSRPPLPQEDVVRLKNIFRRVDSVTAQ